MPRLIVPALALLVACASGPKTASGRPELLVAGITKDTAKQLLLADAAADGWTVEKSDDAGLVVARQRKDVGSALAFDSSYDSTPYTRPRYTIVEERTNVHVYAQAHVITNYGSAFERVSDVSDGKMGVQVQDKLVDVFQRAASRPQTITEVLGGRF